MPNEPASSRAQALLAFWFDEVGPARWWRADPALDAQIAERFGALHAAACACELEGWRASPCLLYTSPSPRDQRGSRMPSSA